MRRGVSLGRCRGGPIADEKALAWREEAVGVIGVQLQSEPQEYLEEVAQQRDIDSHRA